MLNAYLTGWDVVGKKWGRQWRYPSGLFGLGHRWAAMQLRSDVIRADDGDDSGLALIFSPDEIPGLRQLAAGADERLTSSARRRVGNALDRDVPDGVRGLLRDLFVYDPFDWEVAPRRAWVDGTLADVWQWEACGQVVDQLWVPVVRGGAVDDFNRGDSSTVGGNWVEQAGDWAIESNTLVVAEGVGVIAFIRNTTDLGSADHYCETVVSEYNQAGAGETNFGAFVRHDASTNAYDAEFDASDSDQLVIIEVTGGSPSTLAASGDSMTISSPDTIRAEVEGSAIRGYWNTVLEVSTTDATITGTQTAGLHIHTESASDVVRFDSWAADALEEPPPPGGDATAALLTEEVETTSSASQIVDAGSPAVGAGVLVVVGALDLTSMAAGNVACSGLGASWQLLGQVYIFSRALAVAAFYAPPDDYSAGGNITITWPDTCTRRIAHVIEVIPDGNDLTVAAAATNSSEVDVNTISATVPGAPVIAFYASVWNLNGTTTPLNSYTELADTLNNTDSEPIVLCSGWDGSSPNLTAGSDGSANAPALTLAIGIQNLPEGPYHVLSTGQSTGTNSPRSHTLGTTPDAGDLLLLEATVRNNGTITPAAGHGWVLIDSRTSGTGLKTEVYGKVWGLGGQTDSVTLQTAFGTPGNGNGTVVTIVRNPDHATDPWDSVLSGSAPAVVAASGQGNTSSTTMTAPDVSVTGDNVAVLRFFSSADDNNHGSPSEGALAYGGTAYDQTTGDDYAQSLSVLEDTTIASSTGTATMTQGSVGPDVSTGHTIVLAVPASASPQTVNLVAAAAVWSAQALVASTEAQTVSLSPTSASWSAGAMSVEGPATVSVTAATAVWSAQVLAATGTAHTVDITAALAAWTAQVLTAASGGQTVDLVAATAAWSAETLTSDNSPTVSITAALAAWTASAFTLTGAAASVPLSPAAAAWTASALTVTGAEQTAGLTAATAAWTARPLSATTPSTTVSLVAATATWAARALVPAGAAPSVALVAATASWAAQALVSLGVAATVDLASASASWSASALTSSAGIAPQTVDLSPALAVWSARALTATGAASTAALTAALAVWSARPLAPSTGPQTRTLTAATASWDARQLVASTPATTVSVSPAVAAWSARPLTVSAPAVVQIIAALASWSAQALTVTPAAGATVSISPALATWVAAVLAVSGGFIPPPLAGVTAGLGSSPGVTVGLDASSGASVGTRGRAGAHVGLDR